MEAEAILLRVPLDLHSHNAPGLSPDCLPSPLFLWGNGFKEQRNSPTTFIYSFSYSSFYPYDYKPASRLPIDISLVFSTWADFLELKYQTMPYSGTWEERLLPVSRYKRKTNAFASSYSSPGGKSAALMWRGLQSWSTHRVLISRCWWWVVPQLQEHFLHATITCFLEHSDLCPTHLQILHG